MMQRLERQLIESTLRRCYVSTRGIRRGKGREEFLGRVSTMPG
jgi:hypothetical protein